MFWNLMFSIHKEFTGNWAQSLVFSYKKRIYNQVSCTCYEY